MWISVKILFFPFTKAALHGSCPVKKGIKFVATKWIRDKPARFWD